MRPLLGLILAFAIGFAYRAFRIPSPAPPVIVGALLVVAMTTGYLLVDRWMNRAAQHALACGRPSGLAASGTPSAAAMPSPFASKGVGLSEGLAHFIYPVATKRAIRFIALIGLCAAYLQGGLDKLLDFGSAVAEAQHFGLPFAPVIAAATIVTELAGSALILSGVYRWIGALSLARVRSSGVRYAVTAKDTFKCRSQNACPGRSLKIVESKLVMPVQWACLTSS